MTRRLRLKKIKKLRLFRDRALSMNEEQLKDNLMSIGCDRIQISHGWTTWVTVRFEDRNYVENCFWCIDSLRKIAKEIYRHLISKLTP